MSGVLMSMVHPYSISLTNHRKVTIRSLTSRSATGTAWMHGSLAKSPCVR